jgi:hypothetical protein
LPSRAGGTTTARNLADRSGATIGGFATTPSQPRLGGSLALPAHDYRILYLFRPATLLPANRKTLCRIPAGIKAHSPGSPRSGAPRVTEAKTTRSRGDRSAAAIQNNEERIRSSRALVDIGQAPACRIDFTSPCIPCSLRQRG